LQKDQNTQKLIIPYLLGELSPEEREKLEDQYFDDASLFEEMGMVEDELIEAQLNNELSGPALERFKEQFSKSARRENLDFTKALLSYAQAHSQFGTIAASPTPQVKQSGFRLVFKQRWAVATALVFMVLGGVSLIYLIRARREVNQLRNERAALEQRTRELENKSAAQNTRIEQLASELDRAREGIKQSPTPNASPELNVTERGPSVATGIVIARLVRSKNNRQILNVSPAASVLRLHIVIEKGNYQSYGVIIGDDNGEVFRHDQARPQQTLNAYFIVVEIPLRQLLPRHRYLLKVSGVDATGKTEDVGQTYFSFVKR